MACVCVRACERVSLAPAWCVRTSNFYAQYSTGKHEAALCLWNAKNGEKNPDNVPERRAHRVTHQARGGGGGGGRAGPTVTAAYSVIYPHRTPTTPFMFLPLGSASADGWPTGISVSDYRQHCSVPAIAAAVVLSRHKRCRETLKYLILLLL